MNAETGGVGEMEVQEKAFELFAQGKSVNAVASELFNGNWLKAKKAKDAWDATQGRGASSVLATAPVHKSHAIRKAGKPKKEEVPEDWDLTITVPTARLDEILQALAPVEKATAIQNVLQARIDAALA
jgi:hypothetical protein